MTNKEELKEMLEKRRNNEFQRKLKENSEISTWLMKKDKKELVGLIMGIILSKEMN